jgi:hypothetical protein
MDFTIITKINVTTVTRNFMSLLQGVLRSTTVDDRDDSDDDLVNVVSFLLFFLSYLSHLTRFRSRGHQIALVHLLLFAVLPHGPCLVLYTSLLDATF